MTFAMRKRSKPQKYRATCPKK